MYTSFQLAKKYLHYYLTAHNGKGHGMHSPFVFQFILQVLNNKSAVKIPSEIELLRRQLNRDQSVLTIEDFGAGSRTAATKQRSVKQLTRTALKPKKYAQLFYRLVNYYKPSTIIELGTSLGLTTAYMAKASPSTDITTMEGSKEIAAIAQENFSKLKLDSIKLFKGNFDDLLPATLSHFSAIDMAYVDGNHRYHPTVAYFQQLLSKAHNNSVFVFDDIHWSKEMEQAWEEIKQHPSVRCTVDIFFLGFVFFREEFKTPQHFTIRF